MKSVLKVLDTINKIERSQATHCEINKLWSEIKILFLSELEKLPSIPVSFNKKQKKLFRKSQPFWNSDLETLWKTACQMEKNYVNFKVKSPYDQNIKAHLRMEFKNAQKIFNKSFRKAQRTHKKQSLHELEMSAKQNPTDMWSRLKKLSNPPSSRAALEIVRNEGTISYDLKKVLEGWLLDISKHFPGIV